MKKFLSSASKTEEFNKLCCLMTTVCSASSPMVLFNGSSTNTIKSFSPSLYMKHEAVEVCLKQFAEFWLITLGRRSCRQPDLLRQLIRKSFIFLRSVFFNLFLWQLEQVVRGEWTIVCCFLVTQPLPIFWRTKLNFLKSKMDFLSQRYKRTGTAWKSFPEFCYPVPLAEENSCVWTVDKS